MRRYSSSSLRRMVTLTYHYCRERKGKFPPRWWAGSKAGLNRRNGVGNGNSGPLERHFDVIGAQTRGVEFDHEAVARRPDYDALDSVERVYAGNLIHEGFIERTGELKMPLN